jgi:hypothetical protein
VAGVLGVERLRAQEPGEGGLEVQFHRGIITSSTARKTYFRYTSEAGRNWSKEAVLLPHIRLRGLYFESAVLL